MELLSSDVHVLLFKFCSKEDVASITKAYDMEHMWRELIVLTYGNNGLNNLNSSAKRRYELLVKHEKEYSEIVEKLLLDIVTAKIQATNFRNYKKGKYSTLAEYIRDNALAFLEYELVHCNESENGSDLYAKFKKIPHLYTLSTCNFVWGQKKCKMVCKKLVANAREIIS